MPPDSVTWNNLRQQAAARRAEAAAGPRILLNLATCGRAAGALQVRDAIVQELVGKNIQAWLVQVGCLGHCYAEPTVIIVRPGFPTLLYGYLNPQTTSRLVNDYFLEGDPCLEFSLGAMEENELFPTVYEQPRFRHETKELLRRCGLIDPNDIFDYIGWGGYEALFKALGMPPEEIIEEVEKAGLRGRGGAGFPAAVKWRICRRQPDNTRYIIGNGDEGDPGAFMDRALMESDPHSIVEGLIIAAHATGAGAGYLYIRDEYPLAVAEMENALVQARQHGLLGQNILGSGLSFDAQVVRGAGAFVCGETTALVRSIEGKRPMPRPRPPYLSERGLWGHPTVINNVKTLAYVPLILNRGPEWFASVGTPRSQGTAVFALAGKVLNTGLIEIPMGTTIRDIVFAIGGGIPQGNAFKAVQIGGPSGGCLPESLLDTPVDFDSLTAAGAMMGSGGLVVLDQDNCMVEAARYFLDFTQRESCGRCSFCRLGTKRMLDILDRITRGEGKMEDLGLLEELAAGIREGSLCGLGKTAPNPVLTTLRYFREEYEAHIKEKRCAAGACPALTAYYIVPAKCLRSCDACVGTCPTDAIITGKKGTKIVDQSKCVKCGTCVTACPPQYRAVIKLSPVSALPAPGP
ncbi:MAG: SLBB domain-containing protein [Chloroflexi bacterium]|nr:SLBB domain-containing protein [Chloroflexota bacterium]